MSKDFAGQVDIDGAGQERVLGVDHVLLDVTAEAKSVDVEGFLRVERVFPRKIII